MVQGWVVATVSLGYLGILFAIAWYGDRKPKWLLTWRPWIYSLSIAVYCTSWTFYGTVGQASENLWSFLPIYLAPIIVFTLGWRILARLILIAKREHITSIADFIAVRYGKSQWLAVLITIIAVMGILPYISLQLRGITLGLEQLTPNLAETTHQQGIDIVLLLALGLAAFTIIFGTRHIDSTEHHRGMIMAVAFESLIKLIAFLVVGVFAVGLLYSEPTLEFIGWQALTHSAPNMGSLLIHSLLAMAAIICLPRQFYTTVVENHRLNDLHKARWVFPLYLVLMGIFVIPLAWVGQQLLPGISADTYVINLPLLQGEMGIALLAFIGGTSAATAMVIVSTIALATMVSNDLVLPMLLRRLHVGDRSFNAFSELLLNIRRVLIVALLLAAWGFYHLLDDVTSLAVIGFLSFAAIAQFSPALLGGIYWRYGNKKGVYAGLFGGISIWLVTMMSQTGFLTGTPQGDFLLVALQPPQVAMLEDLKVADWGMLLSLIVNAGLYWVVSLATRSSITERLQAESFVGASIDNAINGNLYQTRITVAELEMVAARFIGHERVQQAFQPFYQQQQKPLQLHQQASSEMIKHTERVLAGIFGVSTSRLVLTSALKGRNMHLDEVATIVDEATELFDFSRSLLQGSIEHIGQGIAVVDKHLRLVAWNQRYLELFSFPAGLIQVGKPISDVIRHNAEQGLCGPGDPEFHVAKRVAHLRSGSPHTSSRIRENGQVIEVQGNPMPGGGFVMSFSDITAFRKAEQALKEANENLEARVQERTQQLEQLNSRLVTATRQAEFQAQSKSRFLAAVSHDLMQPLNAARLFSSSLTEVAKEPETVALSKHIESALEAAESLIGDLLDVSRIEAGKLNTQVQPFMISDVLDTLSAEFGVLAHQQGIQFSVVSSQEVIISDAKLLRRALQNFLTNAFRYNPKGKVVLGLRRQGNRINIEVWDNGPGISEDKQADIFNEFTRVEQAGTEQGLGLGLAIARGISRVLDHPLHLRSWLGRGTVFSLSVPRGLPVMLPKPVSPATQPESAPLSGLRVLCVDNERHILLGMETLLQRWGCDIRLAENLVEAVHSLDEQWQPDVILSDYHLANNQTGLEVLLQCRLRLGDTFKGVVISADRMVDNQLMIRSHGFEFLSKPVKPLKLRTLLKKCLEAEAL